MEKNNKITLEIGVPQTGKIKVHTEIINDLSSGIYSSPAQCIKELVNNSYDAEAKLVTIRIKPIQDSITLIDDGNGMNAKDFDKNFAWISKSNKRKNGELSPKLKRPLIGKIGIGFIAVNEICDELEITSTKTGEAFKFTANINFKKYFEQSIKDESSLYKEGDEGGIIKAEYDLINEQEVKSEHYTVIKLLGLKPGVKQILEGQLHYTSLLKEKNKNYNKSYFKNMKDILFHHHNKSLRSYSEDNEYVKFIIDLSSYIPVEYIEGGPVEGISNPVINKIVDNHGKLDFKVDLDGIFLKKPIFFPEKEDTLRGVKSFSKTISTNGEKIVFSGYFYAQNKILYPREMNGISVRIKGIPIASRYGYDTSFLQYPTYLQQLFMNWISGEIYIQKGLEEAMNIDRASFRVSHPHYLILQDFVHRYIHTDVIPFVYTFYNKGKEEREDQKEKAKKDERRKIIKSKKFKLKFLNDVVGKVRLKKTSSSMTLEVDKKFFRQFKRKDWESLVDIFLIFEIGFLESKGDTEVMKDIFYQKINEWKNKYSD
jgi:hypothetical protein